MNIPRSFGCLFPRLVAGVLLLMVSSLSADPSTVAKSARELISQQAPAKVYPEVLEKASVQPLALVVSIGKQRAFLMVGGRIAVDTPISSGRRNGWTPRGSFSVLEKDPNHFSTLYGNFVNGSGLVVRSGVSSKLDSAPSGTHFSGAPMKYFLRLTPEGVGMHAGILPGYPASHGCIRLPREMAELIYSKVQINTPVSVGD